MIDSPLCCLSSIVMLTAVYIGSCQTILAENRQPEQATARMRRW